MTPLGEEGRGLWGAGDDTGGCDCKPCFNIPVYICGGRCGNENSPDAKGEVGAMVHVMSGLGPSQASFFSANTFFSCTELWVHCVQKSTEERTGKHTWIGVFTLWQSGNNVFDN